MLLCKQFLILLQVDADREVIAVFQSVCQAFDAVGILPSKFEATKFSSGKD